MYVSAALCVIFVLLLLLADWRNNTRAIAITKTLASGMFVATGALALPLDSMFGRLMLAGLILGAIGDILLIPHKERTFLMGIGTFLLGHIAYITAFIVYGVLANAVLGATLPLIVLAVGILHWLLPHIPSHMRVPSVAYLVVISIMVAFAFGAAMSGANIWFFVAALAFYTSELAVARNHFIKTEFINRAWGLPFYYAAQLVFALLAH